MSDEDKIEVLKNCFNDVIWMAIRYAHGRHTYAPEMVRDAIAHFKRVFPDWEVDVDSAIKPPIEGDDYEKKTGYLRSDYLDDLF